MTEREKFGPLPPDRWDEADWSMNNSQIARALGVTREAVRAKRAKLGMEPVSKLEASRRSLGTFARDLDMPEGVPAKELSRRYGLSTSTIYFERKRRRNEAHGSSHDRAAERPVTAVRGADRR